MAAPRSTVVHNAMDTSGADLIYCHAPQDSHQDHRVTAAAVRSASRRARRVLMYESPTSVAFQPMIFIDIGAFVEAKLGLLRTHLSQVLKNGLVDLEAVEAQARYHGFRARVRHAEAFASERFLWELPQATIIKPATDEPAAKPSTATHEPSSTDTGTSRPRRLASHNQRTARPLIASQPTP